MRDICSVGRELHNFSALHYDSLMSIPNWPAPMASARSSQLYGRAKAPPEKSDDLAAHRQVVRSGPSEPPRPQALGLLESGLRPTVQDRYSIAALNVLSIRSCPLPSRCSMRRASPLERSNATAPNKGSPTGWPRSRTNSPSNAWRANHPRSAGCSDRASKRRSRDSISSAKSVAAPLFPANRASRLHRCRSSRAARGSTWKSTIRCCRRRRR